MLLKINKYVHKISTGFGVISFVGLFAVMMFTMVCIVLRYVFNAPIKGSTEILEVALSAMVFAGLAYTQAKKGHIHVTMCLTPMPKKLGRLIYGANYLLTTAGSALATYACFMQGSYALGKNLATVILQVPFYPFYYFASLSLLVFTIALLMDTVIIFASLANKECEEYVDSYWE